MQALIRHCYLTVAVCITVWCGNNAARPKIIEIKGVIYCLNESTLTQCLHDNYWNNRSCLQRLRPLLNKLKSN